MKQGYPTETNKDTLRIYWRAVMKHRLAFACSLIYIVAVVCISVIVPLLISQTLAGIVTGTSDVDTHLPSLILVGLVGTLANGIGFVSMLRLDSLTQVVLLADVADTLLARSVGFHTNNIGGKLVSNALDYPAGFSRMISTIYNNIMPFILTMSVGIIVVLSHSLQLGLALLAITTLTVGLVLLESRRRSGLRMERKKAQEKMIANIADTIVNSQAVKTFASEKRELQAHNKLDTALAALRIKDWTGTGSLATLRLGLLLGLQICFIAYAAHLIKQDPSILGIGIFAFAYTLSLTSKLFEVGAMIRQIEESFLQASSMTKILLEQKEIVDASNATKLMVSKGKIDLDTIDFAYDDAPNEAVFSELSLSIPAGQKVGIVGHSGGGKSTLTRLLLRFEDVTQGAILIDGQDIRTVTQESLRKSIGYVPQEPLLFHRSIAENIAYGHPLASQKDIEHAARLAFAAEFIDTLPQQYNTIVGERGVKLSGGQRQRIAIARAILKDAPILILDEATSALDSQSEKLIQSALEKLMKKRTSIVIAHRLSTIQKMDRIIVIENGKIIEDGTHASLLKQKGTYATLWSHQSDGFIE